MNEKLVPEFSSLGKFISISLVFFSMLCCGDFALDAPHSSDPSLMYVVFKSTILVLTKFQTHKETEKTMSGSNIYNQQGPSRNI
jgi:hypothetical protein